jgi:hypothetical protein
MGTSATELTQSQMEEVARAYIARRLLPRNLRGRHWTPPFNTTETEVYRVLEILGIHRAVVKTRASELQRFVEENPRWQPSTAIAAVELHDEVSSGYPRVTSPQPTGFILDASLLDSLIRAEVDRRVNAMKGEIEQHVRKETQAAVMRESERAANTLMHSMASTLQAAVAEEVTRQLEEFTS